MTPDIKYECGCVAHYVVEISGVWKATDNLDSYIDLCPKHEAELARKLIPV